MHECAVEVGARACRRPALVYRRKAWKLRHRRTHDLESRSLTFGLESGELLCECGGLLLSSGLTGSGILRGGGGRGGGRESGEFALERLERGVQLLVLLSEGSGRRGLVHTHAQQRH
jgi:hypothetical protein